MPFDGTQFLQETADTKVAGSRQPRLPIAIALGVGVLLGGIAVSYVTGKTTFAPAVRVVPMPAPTFKDATCDIRQIPLGTPADMVEHMCGKPSEINHSHDDDQWVYSDRNYAYVKDGKLSSWQSTDGSDSFDSQSVPVVVQAPGALVPAPGKAVWHHTTDVYFDSSGKEVGRSTGVHLVNSEFCHPGWRPGGSN
jgi:hypothetical protein